MEIKAKGQMGHGSKWSRTKVPRAIRAKMAKGAKRAMDPKD
jgi:hypothetical protein